MFSKATHGLASVQPKTRQLRKISATCSKNADQVAEDIMFYLFAIGTLTKREALNLDEDFTETRVDAAFKLLVESGRVLVDRSGSRNVYYAVVETV